MDKLTLACIVLVPVAIVITAVAAYLVAWADARVMMGKARFLEIPQYDRRNWQRLDAPKPDKSFFAS